MLEIADETAHKHAVRTSEISASRKPHTHSNKSLAIVSVARPRPDSSTIMASVSNNFESNIDPTAPPQRTGSSRRFAKLPSRAYLFFFSFFEMVEKSTFFGSDDNFFNLTDFGKSTLEPKLIDGSF